MNYTEKTLHGITYQERLHGDVTEQTPIVVVMHWMTGAGTVMDFLFEDMQASARLIFLQAEYPSGYPEGGYSWFPLGAEFYEKPETEQAPYIKEEADKLATFINKLKIHHSGQIIVTGMSQGGDLALHLATYYGALIDVAIPCAGRLSEPMRPSTVENSSPLIHMQQGADDQIVSLDSAKAVRGWLIDKGFNTTLDIYEGVGHDMSAEMRTRIQQIIGEAGA